MSNKLARVRTSVSALSGMFLCLSGVLAAQETPAPRLQATRPELEQTVRSLETRTDFVSRGLVEAARTRLAEGDLQAGDRIVLRVRNEAALTDTFVVRPDRSVELPLVGAVPLRGVLRSELQSRLQAEIGKYVRNPDLRAEALIRLSVLGGVTRPGFVNVPADMLLSDVVMVAGGPAPDGRIDKARVLRTTTVLLDTDTVREALRAGRSLDQLNLASGDEIEVGRRRGNSAQTIGIVTGLLASVSTIVILVRR